MMIDDRGRDIKARVASIRCNCKNTMTLSPTSGLAKQVLLLLEDAGEGSFFVLIQDKLGPTSKPTKPV